jgi:hypothetical protein
MKAELRTGNLINVKTLNKGIQEIEVSINTLTNVESFPELYTPIPLTEEWLVKFGFDCVDGYDDHYYNLTNLELGITLDSLRPFKEVNVDGTKVYVKHVHQLQNLYFALTGEELIIKEK